MRVARDWPPGGTARSADLKQRKKPLASRPAPAARGGAVARAPELLAALRPACSSGIAATAHDDSWSAPGEAGEAGGN